jgi:CHAD domain-containing protein
LNEFITCEPKHDAALQLFTDFLPGHLAEWVQQQLGRIRHKAGAVRDLDVLLPPLREMESQLPDEPLRWLIERAKLQREEQGRHLRRHCRKVIEQGLQKKVSSLLHRVHWRGTETKPTSDEFCSAKIAQLVTSFNSVVDSFQDDEKAMHQVRICGRRIRYTLDILKDFLPDTKISAVGQKLTELQDSLGQTNDRQMTIRFLRESMPEYGDRPFAKTLFQLINSLEITMSEQMPSVIRETVKKAFAVQTLLAGSAQEAN